MKWKQLLPAQQMDSRFKERILKLQGAINLTLITKQRYLSGIYLKK